MVTTLFGDKIISATDLKNNQKAWFAKAEKAPVSITQSGGKQFVLINREHIHILYLVREYSEKLLKYCQELLNNTETFSSNVFPWAKYLSKQDRVEFRDELMLAFDQMINNHGGQDLEEIISSWESTSEALQNEEFMRVVNDTPGHREYVDID